MAAQTASPLGHHNGPSRQVRFAGMTPDGIAALWVLAQKVVNTGKDQSNPLWWAFAALAVVGVIAGFVLHGRRGRWG